MHVTSIRGKVILPAMAALLMLSLAAAGISTKTVYAWTETQGCTPRYWKNHLDTNERAQELVGINVNEAVLDITGIDLSDYDAFDGYEDLTTDQAVSLKGGGVKAFYRQAGAAIFNTYYSSDELDYIHPTTTFTSYIQMAVDGDIEGAKDLIDDANNLGCPLN
jgi:hypothetical protein